MKNFEYLIKTLSNPQTDPLYWQHVCDSLAEFSGGTGTVLIPSTPEARTQAMPVSPAIQEMTDCYVNDGWYRRDIRERAIPIMLRRGYITDFDVLDPERHAGSEYYQEFLGPHGFRWFVGLTLRTSTGFAVASIQRKEKDGPFADADLQRLLKVRPRVEVAVRQVEALGEARANALSGAFRSDVGLFAVGWSGAVRALNDAGEVVLRDTGLLSSPRLGHGDQLIDARLRVALASVLSFRPETIDAVPGPVRFRGADGYMAQIEILPAPSDFPAIVSDIAAVAIARRARGGEDYLAQILTEKFALTPLECRICGTLIEGMDTREVAQSLDLTYETCRFYIKSILRKTDTNSQNRLISLLWKILF